MTREILFETPHGSDLYGLATPSSDRDVYRVVERLPHIYQVRRARYAKQSLRGLEDVLTVDLSTWLLQCREGVPQALEAMWSRKATLDKIEAFRGSFRAGPNVIPTYLRTIKGFCFKGEHDRKFRRHAVRLALNANSILRHGWFNPTLDQEQIEFVWFLADVFTDTTGRCDSAALNRALSRTVFAAYRIP